MFSNYLIPFRFSTLSLVTALKINSREFYRKKYLALEVIISRCKDWKSHFSRETKKKNVIIKKKTLLLFFTDLQRKESFKIRRHFNSIDSYAFGPKRIFLFFCTARKKRKRIARRKIDEKRWLGDCIVLFLVRKQYLTIPFGDLNSYNGRQEEKEVERVDKMCYSARRTDQSG